MAERVPPLSVAIVTDTTACIPPELVERYGIEVVPLNIIFAGRTFTDSLRTDTSEMYELLRTSGERPTTAAPSPGAYVQAIGRAARRADNVLCITVSRQFSAMYDSARQAIEMTRAESPGLELRLLDSRNAAMAQGFVALEAAREAARGAGMEQVVARAEDIASRVALYATLETLTYLARSGRVPRVAAWAAGMLQVRPIVRFGSGDVRLAARARTRQRALDRMTELVVEAMGGRRAHLAVHHANEPEGGQAVLDALLAQVDAAEYYLTEFTQVMGIHTGPGLVGVAFWTE